MNYDRLPAALAGVGLLILGVMLAEAVTLVISSATADATRILNFVASVPFLLMVFGSAYWLSRNEIDTDRYRRIAWWASAGLVFLTGFFSVIALTTQDDFVVQVSIVRWGAAAGAGSGALVGVFEARAIHRAVTGERVRIRNEQLERRNDRLEEFANVLTHDLRNPLNVANGYVEILRSQDDDEYLENIANAHDRMEQIIQDTLVLARSGKAIGETEAVSLEALTAECWSNVDTAQASVTVEQPGTITADPNRVKHLFENLFRNAIEHAGSDASVRVGTLEHGFYVEDDGPGIPEDERESIFDSGYTTSPDGTGFGLAIVRQIVEAHGWEIRVTEGNEGGARFEITGVTVESPRPGDASTVTTAVA